MPVFCSLGTRVLGERLVAECHTRRAGVSMVGSGSAMTFRDPTFLTPPTRAASLGALGGGPPHLSPGGVTRRRVGRDGEGTASHGPPPRILGRARRNGESRRAPRAPARAARLAGGAVSRRVRPVPGQVRAGRRQAPRHPGPTGPGAAPRGDEGGAPRRPG